MRTLALVLIGSLLSDLCATEEIGLGSGTITVHNDDDVNHEIMVSDSATCFAGMRTELGPNTTRAFSIDEAGAFFCIGEGGGAQVQDGRRYVIRGGALAPE